MTLRAGGNLLTDAQKESLRQALDLPRVVKDGAGTPTGLSLDGAQFIAAVSAPDPDYDLRVDGDEIRATRAEGLSAGFREDYFLRPSAALDWDEHGRATRAAVNRWRKGRVGDVYGLALLPAMTSYQHNAMLERSVLGDSTKASNSGPRSGFIEGHQGLQVDNTNTQLERQIVNRGFYTEGEAKGLPYFDVRIRGTNALASVYYHDYGNVGRHAGPVSVANEMWTFQCFAQIVAGSHANFSNNADASLGTSICESDLNGAYITNNSGTLSLDNTSVQAPAHEQRVSTTLRKLRMARRVIDANGLTKRVQWFVSCAQPSGAAVDVTIRLGGLMFVKGVVPRYRFIPTVGTGTSTEEADQLWFNGSPDNAMANAGTLAMTLLQLNNTGTATLLTLMGDGGTDALVLSKQGANLVVTSGAETRTLPYSPSFAITFTGGTLHLCTTSATTSMPFSASLTGVARVGYGAATLAEHRLDAVLKRAAAWRTSLPLAQITQYLTEQA